MGQEVTKFLDPDFASAIRNGDVNELRNHITPQNVNDVIRDDKAILHMLCFNGALEAVKWCILEMGADINLCFKSTPLFEACLCVRVDVIRFLLDCGALTDKTRNGYLSPLLMSIYNKNVDIVKILIDYGAKLPVRDYDDDPYLFDEIIEYVKRRNFIRSYAIQMIGIQKFKLSTVTRLQDVNVLALIGKHVWSFRME